jgi:hypothetical protein
MGKKQVLSLVCPHCTSSKIVRNGHPHNDKLQYFCHTCGKYFSDDSLKGYPPTNIPFPIIAYLLYFRKKIPAFSDMRDYRSFVNQWLRCLGIENGEISRQIIHHWIKNYEPLLDKVISFEEASGYCHKILRENLKVVPKDVIKAKTHPYKKAIYSLEQFLGRDFCVDLARSDPVFFHELTSIVSKYPVYCKAPVEDERRQSRLLFFKGVIQ